MLILRQQTIFLNLSIILIIGLVALSGTLNVSEIYSAQASQTLYEEANSGINSEDGNSNYLPLSKFNSIHNHKPEEVGTQRTFWVWDFTAQTYYETNATIVARGEYCYIYMEGSCISEMGKTAAITQSETLCDEFDNIIYPRVTDLAGHPNGTVGDIDGDPRIVILVSHEFTSYYSQTNEQFLDYSNLCEMFYIYHELYNWPDLLLRTIAHEFHHLIWFNNEMDEPQFILEGVAEYAMYHCGFLAPYNNLSVRSSNFLSHPEDSLLYFNIESKEGLSIAIDYGNGYLFAFYIAEHYGVDILRGLIQEPADGPHGIENVLQTAGYNITFNELYLNWITAITIDELGFGNNLYGFTNLDARISSYTLVNEFPFNNEALSLRYYGFHIHKLDSPPDNFTIKIKKLSDQTIGISVAIHDTIGWHIYQNLHTEQDTRIFDYIQGNSIKEAYVITTFMWKETPVVTRPNYGLGPLTSIEISISHTPTQINPTSIPQTPIETTTAISLGSVVAGIIILSSYLMIFKNNKKSKKIQNQKKGE